jgi:hypothetical protein
VPLIKSASKKALRKNIETELEAHPKNKDQGFAIAYSVQRQARKKRKMADGGAVDPAPEREPMALGGAVENSSDMKTHISQYNDEEIFAEVARRAQAAQSSESLGGDRTVQGNSSVSPSEGEDEAKDFHSFSEEHEDSDHRADIEEPYADGGVVNNPKLHEAYKTVAEHIMSKRKKFADGGMVDLDENAEESPNNEDDMSFEALKKENYDEESMTDLEEPEDSNEKGDDREDAKSDKKDRIEQMRKRAKAKRGA